MDNQISTFNKSLFRKGTTIVVFHFLLMLFILMAMSRGDGGALALIGISIILDPIDALIYLLLRYIPLLNEVIPNLWMIGILSHIAAIIILFFVAKFWQQKWTRVMLRAILLVTALLTFLAYLEFFHNGFITHSIRSLERNFGEFTHPTPKIIETGELHSNSNFRGQPTI